MERMVEERIIYRIYLSEVERAGLGVDQERVGRMEIYRDAL